MRNGRRSKLAAVWLIAALALAACGGDGSAPASETQTPTRAPTATHTPSPAATAAPSATPSPEPGEPPTPTAPPQGSAQVIRSAGTASMTVTLTFDAGADAGYTSQILDTLAANGIIAAFAITGAWAEDNPDLLRRIVNEGHDLINHTYDHSSFTGLSTTRPPLSQAARWEQLDRTEAIVQQTAGATSLP